MPSPTVHTAAYAQTLPNLFMTASAQTSLETDNAAWMQVALTFELAQKAIHLAKLFQVVSWDDIFTRIDAAKQQDAHFLLKLSDSE